MYPDTVAAAKYTPNVPTTGVFDSTIDRFWQRVDKRDACWVWLGKLDKNGYGVFGAFAAGQHYARAHRFAWWLAKGEPPPGPVGQSCDNHACVRPDHLRLVRAGITATGDLKHGLIGTYSNHRCRCPECHEAMYQYQRSYKQRNPRDAIRRAQHEFDARLKKRGLTDAAYAALLKRQGGRCAICGCIPRSFSIDHDHDTEDVRGLLCHNCNLALGHMNDQPERLRAAADYLERTR